MNDLLDRLKRYDPIKGLRAAGTFAATGAYPKDDETSDPNAILKQRLLMNQIQTSDPQFQTNLAQTKANIDLDKFMEQDRLRAEAERARKEAEIKAENDAYDQELAKMNGGAASAPAPVQSGPAIGSYSPMPQAQASGPVMPQGMPAMPQANQGDVPAMFVQKPGVPVWDSEKRRFITEPGEVVESPEYLDPKERAELAAKQAESEQAAQQQQLKNELARSEGLSQLQAIRSTRKGLNFFGPYGGELKSTIGGFPNPLVGTSYPGGSKISDRTNWEANLGNLESTKMIETMMKMKEASKTGATGFGQLTEKEGQVLREASMKLRRNLSPQDAKPLIDQMEAIKMKELGMELSPEQQMIIDQINSGTYPPDSGTMQSSNTQAELDEINRRLAQLG